MIKMEDDFPLSGLVDANLGVLNASIHFTFEWKAYLNSLDDLR